MTSIQLILHNDIFENIIQYLNQVDLASLARTCKIASKNVLISTCLKQIHMFLNKKVHIENIASIDDLIKKNIIIPKNTDNNYTINDIYYFWQEFKRLIIEDGLYSLKNYKIQSNVYVLNLNLVSKLENTYFRIYENIHSLDYNIYKLIKINIDDFVIYKFEIVKDLPELYPPTCFIGAYSNFYYNEIFTYNKKNPVINNNTVLKNIKYQNIDFVYEFNISDCKSKVAYFIKYVCYYKEKKLLSSENDVNLVVDYVTRKLIPSSFRENKKIIYENIDYKLFNISCLAINY